MSDQNEGCLPVLGCGGLIAGVVLFLGVIWGVSAGVWGLKVATAGIYGRGEAHIKINSADFRIQAYDHFFNACSSIQGLEGSIDELTSELSTATDARTKSIIQSSLTGVKAARHQAIANYNADARKNYTEGQFRDNDLPYQLSDSNYPEQGAKTSCGAG